MNNPKYLVIGNWSFIPGPRGVTVYKCDGASGDLEQVSSSYEEITAGQICLNKDKSILYSVDERGSLPERTGGGGYVISYSIDKESGAIKLINKQETLSTEPCFITMDLSGDFLLVACHGDSGWATKLSRDGSGKVSATTVFDDVALLLFRVEKDGSIGELCDEDVIEGAQATMPARIPHLHSVNADPNGDLYVVCDKGLDRVYTYRLDRANGKLVRLQTIEAARGTSPRYGIFHPTLPIFYHNNEKSPTVTSYKVCAETGKLSKLCDTELLITDYEGKKQAQDIVLHPNGGYMYVSFSEINCISVLKVKADGSLEVIQNIPSGGNFSRALCFAPDAKRLYVGNMLSQDVTVFKIGDDGILTTTAQKFPAVRPSVMRFV